MSPHVLEPRAAHRSARGRASVAALLLVALLAALGPLAVRARAADSPPDVAQWAHDLPHEVMSPFCPGRALAECPSSQADELRRWIIAQARAGATREEVEATLYRNFGDQIRQIPRAEGVTLFAYLAMGGFVLAGAAVLALFLLRRSGGAQIAPPPPAGAADPELARLLDREIEEDEGA